MKKDIGKLLSFLEELERNEDVIRHPYEVCVDCQEVLEPGESAYKKHRGHTVVFQDCDHSGVSEWIKCLRWVLGK